MSILNMLSLYEDQPKIKDCFSILVSKGRKLQLRLKTRGSTEKPLRILILFREIAPDFGLNLRNSN